MSFLSIDGSTLALYSLSIASHFEWAYTIEWSTPLYLTKYTTEFIKLQMFRRLMSSLAPTPLGGCFDWLFLLARLG